MKLCLQSNKIQNKQKKTKQKTVFKFSFRQDLFVRKVYEYFNKLTPFGSKFDLV